MAQLLPGVDPRGEETDFIKVFWAIKRDGDWHDGSAVLFLTPDGNLILQRQAKDGLLYLSAAGHREVGATPEETAVTETREETALELDPARLHPVKSPVPGSGGLWRFVSERDYTGPARYDEEGIYRLKARESFVVRNSHITHLYLYRLTPGEWGRFQQQFDQAKSESRIEEADGFVTVSGPELLRGIREEPHRYSPDFQRFFTEPVGDYLLREAEKVLAGAEEVTFDQEGAMELGIDAVVRQHIGLRLTQQDDYALVSIGKAGEEKPAGVLAVLADGMGGHAAGDLASRIAVVRIPEILQASDAADLLRQYEAAVDPTLRRNLGENIQARIQQAVEQAHQEIRELGDLVEQYRDAAPQLAEQENLKGPIQERAARFGKVFNFGDLMIRFTRPGSTVVVAVMTPSTAFIASVGDSRIYLYGHGLGLSQQTEDNVFYGSLAGYLGNDGEFELQQRVIPLRPGDRLLLTSDGLTNAVSDDDIERMLADDPTTEGAADDLMAAAKIAQASDNYTVVLVNASLQAPPEEKPAPPVPAPEPSRTDRLIFELGLDKIPEMRMAVVSFEAAQQYPQLQPFIGRPPTQMGKVWLFVLPQETGTKALWELLESALKDQIRQVKIWEYGDLASDRSLGLFSFLATSEGLKIASTPEPVQGRSFQSLLAGILAAVRGPAVEIKPEDTQRLEELLSLFA